MKKNSESKNCPQPVKKIHLLSGDLALEKLCMLRTTGPTKCNILHPPTVKVSVTPFNNDLIPTIIPKYNKKSRFIEPPRLKSRPRTVLNLKNKQNFKENAEKSNELLDDLPKCLTMNDKKEVQVVGDFELGQEIGKGAYGTVRIGVHRITGSKVAIKSYEKSTLLHPARKKGVEREIRILMKIKHPNIIHLIDTVETASCINLIFEYISGCSLLEYLKSRSSRRIEESQARGIFKQVLLALDFCHSMGITHRDIKLENILLQDNHVIKIIDFGLSTYIIGDRKVQLFCGTMSYMAPEILMGKEAFGPLVDIWACTVMLYILVTGIFPFKGNGYQDLSSKIMRKIYVLPPGLSHGIKEVFRNVFESDVANRPSAAQMLANSWVCANGKNATCSLPYC